MIPMVVIPIYSELYGHYNIIRLKLIFSDATLGFGRHFWDVDPKYVIILRKVRPSTFLMYDHQLTNIALLHLPDILSSGARPCKGFHPSLIPPDFPRQVVSPHHTHISCVDGMPHCYICRRRRLPMHTCRSLMGLIGTWKMCESAGFRLCGCCSEHF